MMDGCDSIFGQRDSEIFFPCSKNDLSDPESWHIEAVIEHGCQFRFVFDSGDGDMRLEVFLERTFLIQGGLVSVSDLVEHIS